MANKKPPNGKGKAKPEHLMPEVAEGTVTKKKKWQRLRFWDKRKLKKKGDTAFLIKMFFSNGTCKEFVVATPNETFTYNKRTYYLRKEDISFNLTQNQFELNYFDDFPVPISIKEIVRKGNDAFWSVSPDNLKPLIKMNYVKALASTDDLNKWMKMSLLVGIFTFMLMLWVFLKVSRIAKITGV